MSRMGLESRWNFLPKFIQKTRFFGLGTLEPACVRSGSRRVCEAIFDAGGATSDSWRRTSGMRKDDLSIAIPGAFLDETEKFFHGV